MNLHISILTVCPEMLAGLRDWPVIRRAIAKGALELDITDIREYAHGSFRHVDDAPFGGGPGMVMRCQPVVDALRDLGAAGADKAAGSGQTSDKEAAAVRPHTVLLSPAGHRYCQADAHRFAEGGHLILVCGHYEGVDARIVPFIDEEISVGDYILTGGEPAAMLIADSTARLLPGALRPASTEEESFENGLLEYPQYTQPAVCEGMEVPDVLRSGDHEKIRRWRLKESLRLTKARRPDLLQGRDLSPLERRILEELETEEHGRKAENGSF